MGNTRMLSADLLEFAAGGVCICRKKLIHCFSFEGLRLAQLLVNLLCLSVLIHKFDASGNILDKTRKQFIDILF